MIQDNDAFHWNIHSLPPENVYKTHRNVIVWCHYNLSIFGMPAPVEGNQGKIVEHLLSVLLYGVEMWTLTSAQEKDSMPSILNIFARLRVSFSEISHWMMNSRAEWNNCQSLRFYEQAISSSLGMSPDWTHQWSQCYFYSSPPPRCKWPRGCPRACWSKSIQAPNMNLNFSAVWMQAQNIPAWKKRCCDATPCFIY